MNKVTKGTPLHSGPSLCESCRHATIVRGVTIDEEIIQCGSLNSRHDRIVFRVATCSAYADRRRPSLGMMQEIAWELRTDRSGKKIGFVSPADNSKLENESRVIPLRRVRNPFNNDDEY